MTTLKKRNQYTTEHKKKAVALVTEKDYKGQSHWIPLASRMAIQALLAKRKGEQRVYVVTVDTPPKSQWIHDSWSRLVKLDQRETI